MSWQKYAVVTVFFPVVLGLSACADTTKKYRDTSELERPPELEIVVTQSEQLNESTQDSEKSLTKELRNLVSLQDDSHLIINRSFDVAWLVLEKLLTLSGIEITDRNREKGQYYVVFDPDTAEKNRKESENLFTGLFSLDNYPKGRYVLTFYENPKSVKISAEFLEYTEGRYSAQDGSAEKTPADNGVAKLLKKLYSTLDDDLLPVN